MTESVNCEFSKRVIFPPGGQYNFLLKAKKKLKLSWLEFAKTIGVCGRTLNDWKREKYHTPLDVIYKISYQASIKIPKNVEIKDPFWYTAKGGKIGGLISYKRYGKIGGDPEYRKKKWYEWWEREGKYKCSFIGASKSIRRPKLSRKLAEFVGIMIGDGGITKNQVTVSLDFKADRQYIIFVKDLFVNLFGVKPSVRIYSNHKSIRSWVSIVVSRMLLVNFCHSIGLKIGNKLKQNLDIPGWIKKKKSFKIACMRGLLDTDGCFLNECHKIKEKTYCYPRLVFTSYSEKLRSSVMDLLQELNFSPKIRCRRNVQLEKKEDIIRYFNLVGTSNPKHRKKFEKSFGGVG